MSQYSWNKVFSIEKKDIGSPKETFLMIKHALFWKSSHKCFGNSRQPSWILFASKRFNISSGPFCKFGNWACSGSEEIENVKVYDIQADKETDTQHFSIKQAQLSLWCRWVNSECYQPNQQLSKLR